MIRTWMRGVWRLPDGQTAARIVRRDVVGNPDDEEPALTLLQECIEELRAVGYPFAEGAAC